MGPTHSPSRWKVLQLKRSYEVSDKNEKFGLSTHTYVSYENQVKKLR